MSNNITKSDSKNNTIEYDHKVFVEMWSFKMRFWYSQQVWMQCPLSQLDHAFLWCHHTYSLINVRNSLRTFSEENWERVYNERSTDNEGYSAERLCLIVNLRYNSISDSWVDLENWIKLINIQRVLCMNYYCEIVINEWL